ncbi:MAG: riboflavin synthase, partial [Mangrovibacterium sp.]
MFSGIVEEFGIVKAVEKEQENYHFTVSCSFMGELKIDQSLSHNGVCLTVVSLDRKAGTYTVTAIRETIERSNLGLLEVGSKVNLERSMPMNGRLDGHIVQGHVDQTAVCEEVEEADGSWYYTFAYACDKKMARKGYLTVEKGSVTVNGVSLTVVNSKKRSFQVAIIPYTYEHTNF